MVTTWLHYAVIAMLAVMTWLVGGYATPRVGEPWDIPCALLVGGCVGWVIGLMQRERRRVLRRLGKNGRLVW